MIACPSPINADTLEMFRRTIERRRRRYRLLQRLSGAMIDMALDVAAEVVDDFPEEVEQVELVREFLHAVADGETPDSVPKQELRFVLGVLIAAFGIDCHSPQLRTDLEAELAELTATPDTSSACRRCATNNR